MNVHIIALCVGALVMPVAGDTIHIEPGKQLPQLLAVHLGEKFGSRDMTIRYMLFVPSGYRASGKSWPLMLFLHGLGECSSDDLLRVKIHGPAKLVEKRPDFPFVVVTPQLPPPPGYKEGAKYTNAQLHAMVDDAWKPDELIQLVDHVTAKLNIDRQRVYVTGLSMGGYGTWRLVATYPDRFAAAVPICGGGESEKWAASLSRVPIWAFHGAKDPLVPLSESQKMVDTAKRAGGDVRLTVYPEAAHDSWTATYNNQKIYDWLLSHRSP